MKKPSSPMSKNQISRKKLSNKKIKNYKKSKKTHHNLIPMNSKLDSTVIPAIRLFRQPKDKSKSQIAKSPKPFKTLNNNTRMTLKSKENKFK